MKKQNLFAYFFIFLIVGILFHKSIIKGYIPFPGDVLLSSFKPWQVSSYDGYVAGSIPNKAQYPDVIRQMYPWRIEAIRQWQEGKVPLWNPYNFSGTPLLANFQSAAMYPLNSIFLFFSKVWSWTVLVAIQPLFALLFSYLYFRSIRVSVLASLFGAVSYGLSNFMTVWLEYNTVGHIMAWFPLQLLSIEIISEKNNRIVLGYSLLTVSVFLSLLAGHPQVAFYAIFFTTMYGLFRLKGRERLFTYVLILLGFGLSAIQIIPGIELMGVSARANHSYIQMMKANLIQPWQTLMLFFPNLFGNPVSRTYWLSDTYVGKVTSIGLVPLFFLLSAIRLWKVRIVQFFIIATLVIGIFITVNPFTSFLYLFPLPFISSSNPTLMVFLFSFCLATLTSFGIDGWKRETHSLKKLVARFIQVFMGIIVIAAVFLLVSGLRTHAAVALRALLYAGVFAFLTFVVFYIAIRRKSWMSGVLWILLLIHIADLSYAFFKFNPFVPSSYVFPPHEITQLMADGKEPRRFWGYGTAAIDANLATYFRAYSPDGYDPLYPKWYGEFIGASKDGKLLRSFTNDTRSDARIISGFGETDFRDNEFRKRILRSLGISMILDRVENGTTDKTFPPGEFEQSKISDWRILTDLKSPAIVRIASQSKVGKTREEFEKIYFQPDFDVSKDVVFHDQSLPVLSGSGKISLTEYRSDRISASTETDGTTMMLSASTYYPGWRAYIDGKEAPLLRVNWTMSGVILSSGKHDVLLRYEPDSFRLGLWVSVLSLFLFFCSLIYSKKIS
ncbi:MAG: YfhO family protein [Patescibacteria group bacterium]